MKRWKCEAKPYMCSEAAMDSRWKTVKANQDVNTFDFPPRLFYFSLVLLAQQLPTGWLR